ncbi:MAG TPA: hydroxyacid dehydrogenase [Gemmatimonadales bacterium]|nr:hydroxyacid dehydrogenase [Gemmatimonadales bacterium]
MPDRIVVADRLGKAGLDMLRAMQGYEVVETAGKPPEVLEKALGDAVALVVRSETKVTAAMIGKAPKLRVIARAGMGTDTIDVDEASRRKIPVLTAPGANSNSVAEYTFALMLALARKVAPAAASLAAGKWDRKAFEGSELRGKTLGLLGLGRIGSRVASIAKGFGMTAVGYDPGITAEQAELLGLDLIPLDVLIQRADVLSLHVKLNASTRHMLDERRLSLVKKGVLIINTARGALIDDAALAKALQDGRVGGAALDVYDPEPLPADSVLRTAPNVLLTPHLAASTVEAQARVATEIASALGDALLRNDLSAAVNLAAFPK